MRLLVARIREESLKDLLWLDELCNGLVSQARHRRFFEADDGFVEAVKESKMNKASLSGKIILRPMHAAIQGAYIISDDKEKFSWAEISKIFPDVQELLLGEGLKKTEVEEFSKKIPSLQPLEDFLKRAEART